MATLTEKLAYFNFVTVMDVEVWESTNGIKTGINPLCTLDSLRVANFTQEGPTKTAKGGLYANTLARYGKTMRLEMEDVIGRLSALESFMGVQSRDLTGTQVISLTATGALTPTFDTGDSGATITLVEVNSIDQLPGTDYTNNGDGTITFITGHEPADGDRVTITYTASGVVTKVSISDKFSPARYLIGTTFVIDEDGNKQWVKIVIPSFLPDSTFNLNMESEGDFGVININGEVQANACGEFMYFEDDTIERNC